ncbi:30S ribosome-binding factor RbfA [Sporosalibacterium faouarense]|uniref:30S ribosome-binding factor RbfA n=1 Tax=Sporosalibacterium faouarense TaxID=516123 RepID=UPI00141C4620|nr:30S ribosome-binding factor RbfA [Sporosalibacterium faouarense]MTI48039.1 30S ribosome-binding factor RbfA [Bacillota bacterium]
MSSKRIGRISEEVKKIVSSIIRNDLKDPRIATMTSVTRVEVTRDLRYANIYFTVLGKDSEKHKTLKALEKAKGFVRRGIGEKLNLRYTPEPIFHLDESIEHGIYISKLIDKVSKERKDESDEDEE